MMTNNTTAGVGRFRINFASRVSCQNNLEINLLCPEKPEHYTLCDKIAESQPNRINLRLNSFELLALYVTLNNVIEVIRN